MLCKDKITSIFCIIDDILKEINHSKDIRRKVSDNEIITTAFIAATSFYGNHRSAIKFVKQYNLFPNMLEESRFNRRLHNLGDSVYSTVFGTQYIISPHETNIRNTLQSRQKYLIFVP